MNWNEIVKAAIPNLKAPRSPFTNRPLTIASDSTPMPVWENSMDPQWWYGAADGVYTHQVRIPVAFDEIVEAAGVDEDLAWIALGEAQSAYDAAYKRRLSAQRDQEAGIIEAIPSVINERIDYLESRGEGKKIIPQLRAALKESLDQPGKWPSSLGDRFCKNGAMIWELAKTAHADKALRDWRANRE